MRKFAKPALTIDQHVDLWCARGLETGDVERVRRYLRYIGYYRLSPYTLPFQVPGDRDHTFKKGAHFDHILDLYVFDRELRLLIMDPIERIEVALRASITNHMSVNHGPHWYLDRSFFKDHFYHGGFIHKIEREVDIEKRSLSKLMGKIDKGPGSSESKSKKKELECKETFLRHYLYKYDTPLLPPCWMMVEMLPMGQLNLLFSHLARTSDQKKIAALFNVPVPLLISWLRAIQTVRNICAHHSRLWNRELGTSPQLPKSPLPRWIGPMELKDRSIDPGRRVYMILVILQYLLSVINPGSGWRQKLRDLMTKYPDVSKAHMGMPDTWQDDPFWGFSLVDDPVKPLEEGV